jgi:hypothetical protein
VLRAVAALAGAATTRGVSLMMTTGSRRLTEPLESVTAFLGALLLLALAAGVLLAVFAPGSLGAVGRGPVCVTQPGVQYADSGWIAPAGVAARQGASVGIDGTVYACAVHSGIAQRVLYALTEIPGLLVWGGVLLLLWRLIRVMRRAGPFTPGVAAAMRRLGWFIIAASAAAALVRAVALNQLLSTLLVGPPSFPGVILEAVRGLFPVAVLAGAALLTFARIIRLGGAMDDEIKGTV